MNRRHFLKASGTALASLALLPAFVALPDVAAPVVTTATGSAFCAGDVFTIAGKYAYNPVTRQPTEFLQRFIVTAVTSSGGVVDMWPDYKVVSGR